MTSIPIRVAAAAAGLVLLAAAPARATFHLMQIEQVSGGVCGDPGAQAIQLRMRTLGQHLVSGRQLWAWDAAGANPVLLLSFPGNVANSAAGSRILSTTAAFSATSGPAANFTLTAPIPATYLPAGRLTFEDGLGTIYWSLSWGGAAYTGPTTGDLTNDADGNFGPSYPGPLPWTGDRALLFPGAFSAPSTNNAADYTLSASPASFTNNAPASGTVAPCIFGDGFETGTFTGWNQVVSGLVPGSPDAAAR